MPTTFHLRVWTRFLVPVEEAWAWRVGQLPAELGPWRERFALGGGSVPEAELPPEVTTKLGPVGPSWPVRVTAIEPGARWLDTSENALYARFSHEHLFEPTPDGCRYVDAVTFTPRGRAQKLAALLTQRIFQQRHRAAAKVLTADAQATAVSVLRVRVEEAWG
jgi:ligand-binding SRPBCC domain-containing protein